MRPLADEDVLRYHDWVERNRAEGGQGHERPGGLRPHPRHGRERPAGVHPAVLPAAPQGRPGGRRARQRRRLRLGDDPRAAAAGGGGHGILARRPPRHLPHVGLLRSDGRPDQRVLRERRRHLSLLLPGVRPRASHRHPHLGRRRRHPRQPEPGGRRLRVRARVRHLQRQGRVDHRERGRHARHRGGQPARATRWRARTRSWRGPCRRS